MANVRASVYEVITFDCYGTLIDWNAGIAAAFVEAARQDGIALDREAVLAAYHAIEPVVEAEAFRLYRDVLTETARRVAARLNWQLSEHRAGFLAESLPRWPALPETNAALERLAAAGYRLGILSNVDDDLLAGTRRQLSVPFEFTITAQQVGSYKPAHGHFLAAREQVGGRPWLHAAQSYFHDIAPAHALGIPTAWINRTREAPDGAARPLREVFSLTELAEWLA
ncbi:MAG TPA: HAD-IA family hydrolase [Dehalococcoidia bacterium]|jgi:2-haloalkanoic acid dehalogenase type II